MYSNNTGWSDLKWLKSEYFLLALLLLLTTAVYYPALDSRLLLDDYYNLSDLEEVGVKGYTPFIFSGFAGPSGRPVSMLSFALQHEHWPHDRFAFKLVNLVIHIINGVLVYFISRVLFDYTNLHRKYRKLLPLLASLLWLMHPIQISTVLYVVQRMTLLSSFFTLLGILFYLLLWKPENNYNYRSGYRLLVFSILFGSSMVFAVFSKENGILLPVLVLAVEFTLLQGIRRPAIWISWSSVFLLCPVILLLGYLVYGFNDAVISYQTRSYSMMERLLTETRVLFQYLYNIVLPRPSAFSLFHDNYPYSTGLFSPVTTAFSVAGIALLGAASVLYRHKWPVFSFAVLWFLGAHLLESTYLNLELYFEHRNYLASYGVIFLIAWVCLNILHHIKNSILGLSLAALLVVPSVVISLLELDLWSKPVEQALEWQRRSPDSPRAIEDIGNLYFLSGDAEKALEVHRKIWEIYPDEFYPYIKEINIKSCLQQKTLTDEEWARYLEHARTTKYYGLAVISELDALAVNIQKGKCGNINLFLLIRLVVTLAHNPEYRRHWGILHELAAILSIEAGETEAALNNLNQALALRPTPNNHILKIKMLVGLGLLQEAEQAVNDFNQYLKTNKRAWIANKDILRELEEKLQSIKAPDTDHDL
jgi:tetratricopeptide (TPR) repeat protein